MLKRLLAFSLALALLIGGFWYATHRANGAGSLPTLDLGPDSGAAGFARALAPRDFQFPLDHGPHFDYQTEWWYYTGNLEAADGRHFGYQLTLFRRGLTPGAPPQDAGFATNQIYFAHFAVTDVAAQQHTFAERFSRGAAGLAGASGSPYRAWLEDWKAESLNADGSAVHLVARDGQVAIDLTLRAAKPVVRQGDRGLSAKSEQPGNASYYLSYTRLATEGQATVHGQPFAVGGESWFDHEWSTSALGTGIVGWDWFSLQLSDEREVMFYQFRRADGSLGPLSAGTLIEPEGSTRPLAKDEVQITVLGKWRSPETRVEYPARWHVVIPSAQIDLNVEPWLAEQEMRTSFAYWEGAVRVSGTSGQATVTGQGYIELTGYQGSLQGVF